MAETQPYRPDDIIERVNVPDAIKTPQSVDEIVSAAKYAYQTGKNSPSLLPKEYQALEKFFSEQYERGYRERRGIDIVPNNLDLLFQQFAVKKDWQLGRNGFNTFGMAALSYIDGLATVSNGFDRYFGAQEDPRDRKKYRALLLGCSSISSATEFTDFVHRLNPQTTAIVADLDPLAVRLAQKTGATTVQADAQRIPLKSESIDFVATNFLVPNLVDTLGSEKNTLQQMFKEVARVLTRDGRLVMVEQLSRNDLEWVVHYAFEAELGLTARGTLNEAIILPKRTHMRGILTDIPEFIHSEDAYSGKLMSSKYEYGQLPGVTSLVFEESQWSGRKGWKRVASVRVGSSE